VEDQPAPKATDGAIVAELSAAVHESSVAAALFDVPTMTVLTANASALALVGLDVEPRGSSILAFAIDPDVVAQPLRMMADGTILGYEASVMLRHADGGAVELFARVVAIPDAPGVALAVASAEHHADVPDHPSTLIPLFSGMLDPAAFDPLDAVLTRVGDRVPWARTLTNRQWEIVGRLMRGERVPEIASAMYLSQSTVRNHLHAVFAKAGVHSQSQLIALLRLLN
jgi:DNA-binding CsgD family transcriptional regulator